MSRYRLPLTIGVAIWCIVFGQIVSGQRTNSVYKIAQSKPSAYITFVKSGKDSEGNARVWLRLRNNQRFGIRLNMGGSSPDDGDARLFYDVLSDYQTVLRSVRCHVCSTNILTAGKSLLFSIPREDLTESYGIKIRYAFSWESDLGLNEPRHDVLFVTTDVPRETK